MGSGTYQDPNKIHLSKSKGSLEIACFTRPNFQPKMLTDYPEKVTCRHCLKIVESMNRNKTPHLRGANHKDFYSL